MKLFIASDLHGSEYYLRKMIERYEDEKADRILFLGDLLYHGARNDLPKDYNTKEVAKLLNSIKSELLCIKGNCDSDVDQMVLDFPTMAPYAFVALDGINIFATHGDKINKDNAEMLKCGDILLCGHTHIPAFELTQKGYYYINPGSLSIPKGSSVNSYMVYENNSFILKSIDGDIIDKYFIK